MRGRAPSLIETLGTIYSSFAFHYLSDLIFSGLEIPFKTLSKVSIHPYIHLFLFYGS